MVKAIVEIDEEANKVINILKAQYGLKDKSEAINEMAKQYKEIILESELKPKYTRKLKKIQKEQIIRVGTTEDLRKRYGLKWMYAIEIRGHLDRTFRKLAKKDAKQMEAITRKIEEIVEDPHVYKPLHFPTRGQGESAHW
jgi:Protein of unknown function (DUF2683)